MASICFLSWEVSEVYSECSQTSKIVFFEKIVNGFQPLIIFAKSSTLDLWIGSECLSFSSSFANS